MAEASLEVEVSIVSPADVVLVSGLDNVTDPATAKAAKLGRDYAICGAVAGSEMGGAICDEGAVSGEGGATRYVDTVTVPGMGDAIGIDSAMQIRRPCGFVIGQSYQGRGASPLRRYLA